METNKICFICKAGEVGDLEETLESIKSLRIPENVEVQIIKLERCSSTAEAYNKASNFSDAKYKVYVKPGTIIINYDYIFIILAIFKDNSEIALLGTIGAETIPTSGLWWQSKHKCGKIYSGFSGNMVKIDYDELAESYTSCNNLCMVKAVDGTLMATQYEMTFREDLFNGEYFYDTAFCLEYLKAGYKIGVPILEKPCAIKKYSEAYFDNSFTRYRDAFLTEYSNYLFPKVSILIPVFHESQGLERSVNSALDQSYKNKEIIVVDSTNLNLVNINNDKASLTYVKYNAKALEDCCSKCYEVASGELINYLDAGETLQKNKLDIMVNFFIEFKHISMVISNTFKSNYSMNKSLEALTNKTILFKGKELGRFILKNNIDLIGSATGVLFLKSYLDEANFNNHVNVSMWLKLMEKGDTVYISSVLCDSETSDNPSEININNADSFFTKAVEWLKIIKNYYGSIFISDDAEYYKFLTLWLIRYLPLIKWISIDSIAKTVFTESIKDSFKFVIGKLKFSENENFINLALTVEKLL